MKPKEMKALLTAPMRLQVIKSVIAGNGVRTLRDIKQGQIIGFYEGRRFKSHDDRLRKGQEDCSYLFGLSSGELIDGSRAKMGRVNHSCNPSTTVLELLLAGRLEIAFVAKRNIKSGEELTLDYLYSAEADCDPREYRCRCGAPNCSGSLLKRAKPL